MLIRLCPLCVRGMWFWLYVRAGVSVVMVFLLTVERRQVAHSVDAWQEEVRPTHEGGERRQTLEYLADRPGGALVLQRAVLPPANRVPLIAEFVERPVVDPDVLCELELAYQAGADDERCDAAVHPVIWG